MMVTGTWLDDEAIVQRIREASLRMEQRGEIENWLLEQTLDAKLFKLFVPRELGGLAAGLPEALRVFERAAWADGAFGWLVTIGAGGGFFSATLPEREAAELFAPREAVLAGSGMPTGTAKPVAGGGYRISGRWKFCSGSTFASFFTANCWIEREDAEGATDAVAVGADDAKDAEDTEDTVGMRDRKDPIGGEEDVAARSVAGKGVAGTVREMCSFAFLPEQVEIERDWNPLGMRATASHTIVVRDAFVPETMTFDIAAEPRLAHPIYRMPFLVFAQASFAAVAIGVARHYLEEARMFAELRAPEWRVGSPRRLEALLSAIESADARLSEAAERFYAEAASAWSAFEADCAAAEGVRAEAGSRLSATSAETPRRQLPSGGMGAASAAASDPVTPEERWAATGQASVEAADVARGAAQAVFPLLGMTALMSDHPLNRTWRDLHTVTQHSVLLPL